MSEIPRRLRHLLTEGRDIELSELLGPEWREIWIRDRWLILPGWRAGFEPGELRAMLYHCQRVAQLEHQVKRLAAEAERMLEELHQAQAAAAWYRSQLVAESRLGMMLSAIAA